MYYPQHQITVLKGDEIPNLEDQNGENILTPTEVILTGDNNYYEYNEQAIETGNFRNVKQFKKQEQQQNPVPQNRIFREYIIGENNSKVVRYFLYNKIQNKVEELTKKDYISKKDSLERYEVIDSIEWETGKNIDKNKESFNRQQIKRLQQSIPVINEVLKT